MPTDYESLSEPEQTTPLLHSDRRRVAAASRDFISKKLLNAGGQDSFLYRLRHNLQHFLVSKWGHYMVFALVSLDVACIFTDFLLSLHVCEHSGEKGIGRLIEVDEALDTVSLVFSCLFMVELFASIFAFGLGYFKSKFHIFDSLVILSSFIVDVCLHGPVEEAGTLIIVLRLFRIFKIVEESSTVAEETVESMQEQIEDLKRENENLRLRLRDSSPQGE